MRIPEVSVRVGGRQCQARLISLRVSAKLSQPTQAQLTLAGPTAPWPLGESLVIAADGKALFTGEVTAAEVICGPGAETLWLLRGYDQLHRLRKAQRPRVFENVTIASLAQELTGLTVECDDAGEKIPRLVQHRQTDWELLAQMASRTGRFFVLNGQTLIVSRLKVAGAVLQLRVGEQLWQARAEANIDGAVNGVAAIGWNPATAEVQTERAAPAYRSGSTLSVPGQGEPTLVDQPPGQLGDAAQASADAGVARSLHVSGTAVGDPALWPGTGIAVSGLDEAIDGTFVLCETVHNITADGYSTEFSTQPPVPFSAPSGASVTIGRVTGISKDGLAEVTLPAYGDVSAGWLSVLCPGAGPGKGIVALPDPGDQVVVVLPHGNPAEGIVLGSVYGTESLPDAGVEGNSVVRWTLHSGAGQVVVIDDGGKLIRLSNADGSKLELAPDLVTLSANTDMVLEAPGHHLSIRAANVDFEHAVIP